MQGSRRQELNSGNAVAKIGRMTEDDRRQRDYNQSPRAIACGVRVQSAILPSLSGTLPLLAKRIFVF
jgi:hypothetical protein